MRATHLLPLGLVFGAAISVGCSANVSASPEASDAEVSQAATAIVEVARTAGPNESQSAYAVAHFVQMRTGAVDEQALRMVTAAVDLPAMGACAARAQSWTAYDTGSSAPARPLNLANMGALTVEAGGVRTSFAARAQPDVTDLVSGVRYVARPTDVTALPAAGKYAVHVAGTATVDPFDVLAVAPGDLDDVRVAGQETATPAGAAGSAATVASVAIAMDVPVDVTWESGSADDVVFIDVRSRDANVPALRCLYPDAGQATLAAWVFGGIEGGTLSLHRLHRESFRAHGVESGEIRFDFARVVSFSRNK